MTGVNVRLSSALLAIINFIIPLEMFSREKGIFERTLCSQPYRLNTF